MDQSFEEILLSDDVEKLNDLKRWLFEENIRLEIRKKELNELHEKFLNEKVAFVEEMKTLVYAADIILPNITEACFLTGYEYKETYDEAYIDGLLAALRANGAKTVVLTGVGFTPDTTGVMVMEGESKRYYKHRKISKGSHGTGDVYASAFVGAYMRGKSAFEAAGIAAEYTLRCIENTVGDESHWYGVKFEKAIPSLIAALDK